MQYEGLVVAGLVYLVIQAYWLINRYRKLHKLKISDEEIRSSKLFRSKVLVIKELFLILQRWGQLDCEASQFFYNWERKLAHFERGSIKLILDYSKKFLKNKQGTDRLSDTEYFKPLCDIIDLIRENFKSIVYNEFIPALQEKLQCALASWLTDHEQRIDALEPLQILFQSPMFRNQETLTLPLIIDIILEDLANLPHNAYTLGITLVVINIFHQVLQWDFEEE
jgi:hypothetical protein